MPHALHDEQIYSPNKWRDVMWEQPGIQRQTERQRETSDDDEAQPAVSKCEWCGDERNDQRASEKEGDDHSNLLCSSRCETPHGARRLEFFQLPVGVKVTHDGVPVNWLRERGLPHKHGGDSIRCAVHL